jgi:hypothetical protein
MILAVAFVLAFAFVNASTVHAQWGQPGIRPSSRTQPYATQSSFKPLIVNYPPPIRSYWYYNEVGPGYSFGVGTMPPQPVIVAPQPLFVPQQQYFQPFNWGW